MVGLADTEGGTQTQEEAFHWPDVYSPSFNPRLLWELPLPSEQQYWKIARPLQLGSAWPVVWCGHVPELCGSQPGAAILADMWGLLRLDLSPSHPSLSPCPAWLSSLLSHMRILVPCHT